MLPEVSRLSTGLLSSAPCILSFSSKLLWAWSHGLGKAPGENGRTQVFWDCLTFLFLHNNYHELRILTQQSFIRSRVCKSELQHNMTAFSALGITRLQTSQAEFLSRVWEWVGERHLLSISSWCWQSSIPCGCRMAVPVSLLAVSQSSATRGYPHSYHKAFCKTTRALHSFLMLQSSYFPSVWPSDSDLRTRVIRARPTWTTSWS